MGYRPPRKEHKIIDGVEKKYCFACKGWFSLDKFSNDKTKIDGKNSCCKDCDKLKRRKYKCKELDCTTSALPGKGYCTKHNPYKCSIEGCNRKSFGNDNLCRYHDPSKRCKFVGCEKLRIAGTNGFCCKHGKKILCKHKNCVRVANGTGFCYAHYSKGNIKVCATQMIAGAKNRNKKKKMEFTLSVNDIINMYNQDQKCYWCRHHLKLKRGGKFNLGQISLDRINSKVGYTKDNVVLSCMFCNFAKSSCELGLWKSVIKILRGKKHTIDFTKCKTRRKFAIRTNMETDINKLSTKWFHKLLKENNFRCMLTNLPLIVTAEQRFPWNVSVDRIDGSKNHSTDNCQLTCQFINFGKNKMPNEKFKEWFKKRFKKLNVTKVMYPDKYMQHFFSGRHS